MNQSYQNNIPISNSYYGYYVPTYNTRSNNPNDERLVGGFAFPFLLGGVTGAAIAPAFWNNGYGYNRPSYYYPYNPYQYGYPPRRWF